MPSRQINQFQPPQTPPPPHSHHRHNLVTLLIASAAAAFSVLLLLAYLFRRTLARKRAAPFHSDTGSSSSNPPHRLSYSLLRRATNSFSVRLGNGGFGTVYAGTLPPPSRKPVAVKLMDLASGEREFHNELFFASRLRSPHVVAAVGFSSDPKRGRFLLVYELMHNGNLQDALLCRKCPELMDWNKRFAVVLDIARGIHYLHSCDPPVIHGDIKPSNILLDRDFAAKIADFGLARLKSEPFQIEVEVLNGDEEKKKLKSELTQVEVELLIGDGNTEEKRKKEELECDCGGVVIDDCRSMQSVHTDFFEEGNLGVEQSATSPDTIIEMTVMTEMGLSPVAMVAESPGFDKASVQSEKDIVGDVKRNGRGLRSNSVKDWWRKQDNEVVGSGAGSTPVGEGKKAKDYVMEWLGREVNRERPKSEWITGKEEKKKNKERKRRKKQLEWWESMDEEKVDGVVKKKRRPVREWWKEDCCEELAKRKKKKKKKGVDSDGGDWWVSDDGLNGDRKKYRNNRGGVDRWLDGFSGELWRARRNSFDSASGEIPKSGGVSSTPSMRGTVCYVAPEYGCGGDVSEKCDVYSFGVLLLVLISGRRPLQVTGSPMSEFQRANLVSWARHCARNGKLVELVDQSIQSLDKEQALLCIKVALNCLLKSPVRRPSMKEVVGMLSGDLEPPQLPVEYSPSTPSRFPFKSRKKKPVS